MDLTFSLTQKMIKLIRELEMNCEELVKEFNQAKDLVLKNPFSGIQINKENQFMYLYEWKYKDIDMCVSYVLYPKEEHIVFLHLGTSEHFFAQDTNNKLNKSSNQSQV